MNSDVVHVAVAVIIKNNKVLVNKRPDNKHLGGLWEFPGGKIEHKESVTSALVRECKEELSIELKSFRPLIKITHHYDDKSVLLDVWLVSEYVGKEISAEGQEIDWKTVQSLNCSEFPAADKRIIDAIQLPEKLLITGDFTDIENFKNRLKNSLKNNIKLVQVRLKAEILARYTEEEIRELFNFTFKICKVYNATVVFNTPENTHQKYNLENIHLDSRQLMRADNGRRNSGIFSASCHSRTELKKAAELGVTYALLSPVLKTKSHPETTPIGWDKFREYIKDIPVPVYALGGVSDKELDISWQHGAQGVAGINAYWGQE